MEFIFSHRVEILAVLWAVSELLGSIEAFESNSIFQLVVGILKKFKE